MGPWAPEAQQRISGQVDQAARTLAMAIGVPSVLVVAIDGDASGLHFLQSAVLLPPGMRRSDLLRLMLDAALQAEGAPAVSVSVPVARP